MLRVVLQRRIALKRSDIGLEYIEAHAPAENSIERIVIEWL